VICIDADQEKPFAKPGNADVGTCNVMSLLATVGCIASTVPASFDGPAMTRQEPTGLWKPAPYSSAYASSASLLGLALR
jgi:hypothetical protein